MDRVTIFSASTIHKKELSICLFDQCICIMHLNSYLGDRMRNLSAVIQDLLKLVQVVHAALHLHLHWAELRVEFLIQALHVDKPLRDEPMKMSEHEKLPIISSNGSNSNGSGTNRHN